MDDLGPDCVVNGHEARAEGFDEGDPRGAVITSNLLEQNAGAVYQSERTNPSSHKQLTDRKCNDPLVDVAMCLAPHADGIATQGK